MQITGTIRQSSTSARATRSRVGGANVRASSDSPATRRSFTGGDPSQLVPARASSGRRRQHGDEPALGHRAAGRDHPRVAQERALAHLAALDPQPAVAQLVGADEGVVGEERPVADGGERGQHEGGRRLHVLADVRPERPQPHRRRHARVEREQRGARVVHEPQRRPDLPARPAAHRVVPLAEARARAAARDTSVTSGEHDDHRDGAERDGPQRVERRLGPRRRVPQPDPDHEQPAQRRRPRAAPRAPRPSRRTTATQRPPRGALSRGQCRRAGPSNTAGDPTHSSPGGTESSTADPGATSAHGPTRVPGASVLRVPTVARLSIRTRPTRSTSPSSQCPRRSTSGSTAHPLPSVSSPVTGGSACRSTSRADRSRRAPARTAAVHGAHDRFSAPGRGRPGLGEPEPQVHGPAARVPAGRQPAQQRPRDEHRGPHAAERADEHQPPERHPPPDARARRAPTAAPVVATSTASAASSQVSHRSPTRAASGSAEHGLDHLRPERRRARRPAPRPRRSARTRRAGVPGPRSAGTRRRRRRSRSGTARAAR